MKGSANILPYVLTENQSDLIESKYKFEAALKYGIHQLPVKINEWERYRTKLKDEIIRKAGLKIDHKLPFNTKETGSIQMKGYSIKKISFQTRPGIYATANLYIPEETGPFPAVIYMIGHWPLGKIEEKSVQPVGHSLALNGYVCLCIDPWGSGERTTIHGTFEDHGDNNNLASSLMNIGETLIGIEISDNIRGVDLLCSLPFVDKTKIGATGASGGGNQTMWLAAMDERVKAAVPVVSVGTFESYIMGSPCICEVLPDGLTFTEEAGILALIAPRAVKMCNHKKDSNKAFFPSEMLRSYQNARPVFQMFGAENKIAYQIFDLTHGYNQEDRETMLGWFDLHLKGIGEGNPKKEIPFQVLPKDSMMVFSLGKRDPDIMTTVEYCRQTGKKLRSDFLNTKTFDINQKKKDLRDILHINEKSDLKKVHQLSDINGWSRFALETNDYKLIPLLVRQSSFSSGDYVIVCNPGGKEKISSGLIKDIIKSGRGVAIIDLSGTGETSSSVSRSQDRKGNLRTLSRTVLWLGKTVLGEWIKELNVAAGFLKSSLNAKGISIDGTKDAGLAALFLAATEGNLDNIILRDAPVSYIFDNRESVDFYSIGVNLPGFLNWGDISLAAAISGINIRFINPLTMSGESINENRLKEYQLEFEKTRKLCRQPGTTVFN